MARDLTPPPKRTDAQRTADATPTPADLLQAEQTANQLATPAMRAMLAAKKVEPKKPKPQTSRRTP